MTSMNPRPSPTGKRASARLEKAGSTNPSSAMMGNPVKQDRTLAPLSSSTQLALTHAPSGYTPLDSLLLDGAAPLRNEGGDDSSSSRARHQPDGSRIRLDEFHGPDCDHAQSGVARLGHLDDSAGNESGLLEADQTLRVGVGDA